MSSPSIDLDMNLLESSPVPPARGGGRNDGCGLGRQVQESAAEDGIANNIVGMNNIDSFRTTLEVKSSGDSRVIAMTSSERSEHTSNANGSAERWPAKERLVTNDGTPTQNYDDITRMVESWREELYMMNVNNSILLDDLVKLGADV